MALNYRDGFYNAAYHDSETLEIDRGLQSRPSSRQNSSFHHNPYVEDVGDNSYRGEERDWRGGQGPQLETDYDLQIPRYPLSSDEPYSIGHYNPAFQQDLNQGPSYIDSRQGIDNATDVSQEGIHRRSRRQATLPTQLLIPSPICMLDPSLDDELDYSKRQEQEKLVTKLVEMSSADIAKEVRKLPMCLNNKRDLRNSVMIQKQKSSKDGFHMDCCAGCLRSVKLSFRRFKQGASDALEALQLWQGTLKVIGGKFGTSILSYFIFLKWLLMFNIFSFVINFSFITIPQFFDMGPNNVSFTGLELLTGAGYFANTVLYYGFYTNGTIRKEANLAPYNMQLAYILTIGLYLATCFLILLFSIAKSFRNNFINPSSFSGNASKLLCSWDFNMNNEKAVKLRKRHLSTQIKETLSEKLLQKLKLSFGQKLARFGVHLAVWVASVILSFGCCSGVYFLCLHVQNSTQNSNTNDLTKQAATLQVPVVVALINLIMPLVFAMLGLVEKFKYPQHQIYAVIIRNVLLKMSIIGILCAYWLQDIAESGFECWESYIGQDIYRLVVIDFLFVLMGSLFGEFLRRIIGMHCCKKLGMPEFDIARNVLDLIYAQTLAWIGIFFSPLIPLIQMIKLFIIFYVKKVSLTMNCTPPRRAWRASQMTTLFIFLLFFPSFVGVLCVIGVTIYRRQPSNSCGPFRYLPTPYDSIDEWIAYINVFDNTKWVVWIYHNLIESVLFFYILTLIILIISYLYWQILQGEKIMVKRLLVQIANEGKDKTYLLTELRKSQKQNGTKRSAPNQTSQRQVHPSHETQDLQFPNEAVPYGTGTSDALALAMRARQQADSEGESPELNRRAFNENVEASDTMAMLMRARQQAEHEEQQSQYSEESSDSMEMVMRARQQSEHEEQQPRHTADRRDTMEMLMRARQQAEHEQQQPPYSAEPRDTMEMRANTSEANNRVRQMDEFDRQQPRGQKTSDALAMAMKARQQAQME
ncbi:transmembrane channel-like protein 5 [Pseudophryne corroboree]|uniref:transmembrane channel-like protein 5 n=1 Tax=Pseudophryne corroboree TaxID=495146 RepID=UPI003081FDEA